MARYDQHGLKIPTHIMEAGALHYAIQPVCSLCDREDARSFNAVSLWFYFRRRSWDGDLRGARRHFWCRRCGGQYGKRIRPRELALIRESDRDAFIAMVDEREWKREISRWRG